MIYVTKPNLPPLEEYTKYLQGVWDRNWLTNNGPLVNELELQLKKYLGFDNLLFLNNGTIALQLAIKALDLKPGSEIITTPFSYVATTSSIVWEGYKPVFADIDPNTLNIDATAIEQCITPNTSAILATHVYGNPCDITALEKIATKHNLKVIYDAAHCFGSKYKGKTVFSYGDIATTSFHATKIFHTIEGGAVFAQSDEVMSKLGFMRNFGHNGPEHFEMVGINGKNSEFHAAMGLCNMKLIDKILAERKIQSQQYDALLKHPAIRRPEITAHTEYNYSYYAIVLSSEDLLNKVVAALHNNYIYPRRYFYPSLNQLNYVDQQATPISEDISTRVLCLPIYHTLSKEEIDFVCKVILKALI